jgi:hypothetical protein
MAAIKSSSELIDLPSTCTITPPTGKPAIAAGEPGLTAEM